MNLYIKKMISKHKEESNWTVLPLEGQWNNISYGSNNINYISSNCFCLAGDNGMLAFSYDGIEWETYQPSIDSSISSSINTDRLNLKGYVSSGYSGYNYISRLVYTTDYILLNTGYNLNFNKLITTEDYAVTSAIFVNGSKFRGYICSTTRGSYLKIDLNLTKKLEIVATYYQYGLGTTYDAYFIKNLDSNFVAGGRNFISVNFEGKVDGFEDWEKYDVTQPGYINWQDVVLDNINDRYIFLGSSYGSYTLNLQRPPFKKHSHIGQNYEFITDDNVITKISTPGNYYANGIVFCNGYIITCGDFGKIVTSTTTKHNITNWKTTVLDDSIDWKSIATNGNRVVILGSDVNGNSSIAYKDF